MIRRNRMVAWIVSGMTLAPCVRPVEGQIDETREPAPASFHADELRLGALRAVERYRDPARASLDGYRAVGPDFPGMGVHWLRFSTLMGGELDPERPAFLCYVEIEGRATLVNVAYGVALLPGQEPPLVAGLPADPWHDHTGTVEDEMLRPHGHDGGGHGGTGGSGSRVVMVHVWTTPNPEGPFAQHNWGLPFLRAGLIVPDEPSEFAARFVGLGTEAGLRYQLEIVGFLFSGNVLDEAKSRVEDTAEAAARWIGALRGHAVVGSEELRRFDESWRTLGTELMALAMDDEVASTLARLHGLEQSSAR